MSKGKCTLPHSDFHSFVMTLDGKPPRLERMFALNEEQAARIIAFLERIEAHSKVHNLPTHDEAAALLEELTR